MSARKRPALPPLLPEPKRALVHQGSIAIATGATIAIPAHSTAENAPAGADADLALELATLLQMRAREAGLALSITTKRPGRSASIELHIGDAGGAAGEAYSVEVTENGVRLESAGPLGLRHAIETFGQLLAAARPARNGARRVPCCRIEDHPDFALRGLMLDVSRGRVPTLETLEAIVDLMSRMKLNALMLYTEHTFRFPSHPKIGADASPLDAEALRRLDAFAASRGIELIPNLQSLGHMEHVLRLPEYAPLAESPRGWALSPSDEASYELLADLYADLLPNFRSGFFNANCDEPLDLESGRSAELARELGPGGVYTRHVERIHAMASAHGKRTMIWGDVVRNHPDRVEQLAKLDPPLVLLDWWYEANYDYDRAKIFGENGLEFVACPGTSSWNCLFPRIENSLANISNWADTARRLEALGIVNTDWGDFGHYNFQGNSWLGIAWGAQESWSGATEARRFDRAFGSVVFGNGSAALARCYRLLGAVHDPGFRIFNGSALQYAYFDDLDEAYFLSQAKRGRLRQCRARIDRAARAIDEASDLPVRERQGWEELRYAADASRFAIDKCEAALDYIAWREGPASLDARARRALAKRLRALASEQSALVKRFEKLWMARNAISDIEMTLGRARVSIGSLRSAARSLERNRPAAPPPPHEGFEPRQVLDKLRASIAAGGGFSSGGAI